MYFVFVFLKNILEKLKKRFYLNNFVVKVKFLNFGY